MMMKYTNPKTVLFNRDLFSIEDVTAMKMDLLDISLLTSTTVKMSIYIVKHGDNFYKFVLSDEYHHMFLNFWKNNTSDTITIPDDLKKGIRQSETATYKYDMPYHVARDFQLKYGVWGSPLWWYVHTETMKYRIIPQD